MLKKIVMATAALLLAGPLLAGTPVLDQREHNQAQRIRHGVKSGELTRPETRRLVRGQRHLRAHEAHAKADGVVTARERAGLQHRANVQSKRVYRQKHDAQTHN